MPIVAMIVLVSTSEHQVFSEDSTIPSLYNVWQNPQTPLTPHGVFFASRTFSQPQKSLAASHIQSEPRRRIYLHIDNYGPAKGLYESEGFVPLGAPDAEEVTHMMLGVGGG